MSESKIDVWQRKIRNGKRRALIKEQKGMWEKLSSQPRRYGILRSPGVSVTVTDKSWFVPSHGRRLGEFEIIAAGRRCGKSIHG